MRYLNSAQRLSQDVVEITYVLIDFSGSMCCEDYKPNRKDGAIQANIKLITTKAKLHPQDQVGIIGFGDNAQVVHRNVPVGKERLSLCRALRENKLLLGRTDFNKALKLAEKCLFQKNTQTKEHSLFSRFVEGFLFEPIDSKSSNIQKPDSKSTITRRIIMLTDGGHNGKFSPIGIAKRLKEAGVIIECIGIAGNRKEVDEDLLKQIASVDENGIPRYIFINDTAGLIRKYQSMATHLRVPKEVAG